MLYLYRFGKWIWSCSTCWNICGFKNVAWPGGCYRLLSAALHSDAANAWVVVIKEEEVLERIMWMTSNTMNPQLREKVWHSFTSHLYSRLIYLAQGAWVSPIQGISTFLKGSNFFWLWYWLQSTELLLAMVDSRPGLVSVLLPVLLRLGLPELLTDLMQCELITIKEGTSSCGSKLFHLYIVVLHVKKKEMENLYVCQH